MKSRQSCRKTKPTGPGPGFSCGAVSADLKGSHSGRYEREPSDSRGRLRRHPRRPLTGGQAVTIASFFPAAQTISSPVSSRAVCSNRNCGILCVLVIRPGRLDDQVQCLRWLTLANAQEHCAWRRSEGSLRCHTVRDLVREVVPQDERQHELTIPSAKAE